MGNFAHRLGHWIAGVTRPHRTRRSSGPPRLFTAAQALEALESRLALAPVPVVSLSASSPVMIGEPVRLTATFDNQATVAPLTGFGPYVDLFVDTTGADGVSPGSSEPTDYDGFSGLVATYLGATITPVAITLGAGGTFTHPFARTNTGAFVTGTAPAGFVQGDTLYVYELPFGSFVDTQTPVDLDISANLSTEADLSVSLPFAARGGFRYATDALDNPTVDPSIQGALTSTSVQPQVIELYKEYNGPESETATGPNYPRRYTLRADIANGQTVTNLRLTDLLPNNAAFLSVISSSPAGAVIEATPTGGTAANPPDNDLVVRFPSVTGGTGTNDANVVLEFFVPEFDANGNRIISATTGDDVPSINDGRATGSWTPIDPNDSLSSINIVDQATLNDNYTLTEKSIAIQKSHLLINDVGAVGPSPGDTVRYLLDFQISDYFTFGDLVVEDILSDGLRLAGSPSGPFTGAFTFSVTDRNGTVAGNFNPSLTNGATNFFVDLSDIGNDTNPATTGNSRLVFDLSRAMTEAGASDGILQGGRAVAPNTGAATGSISFDAVIQQTFSDTYPSGDPVMVMGDLLDNQATIAGTVRNNAAIGTVVGTEADDTFDQIEIVTGAVLKTVYAINGVNGTVNSAVDPASGLTIGPSYASSLQVRPGDIVTYRVRFALPTGDVENFVLTDYLPLPVFDVSSFSNVFDTTISSTAPSVDSAKYGPDHTFTRVGGGPPSVHPTITVNSGENNIAFNFGDYDQPPPESPSVLDLLLSVQITDEPMADGLFLTNQIEARHGTTNTTAFVQADIVQITLTEPELAIRKGIVSSNNSNRVFSSTVAPSGITFEAPGISSPASSFTGGTIHSTNLGTTLNANVSRVDADDLVKFAIVVENTGLSSAGAFDIRIRDSLPTGFVIPSIATGLNLEVFDGTGAAIPFTTLGTGLFDPAGGIELSDPGPTPATTSGSPPVTSNGGAIDGYQTTSGRNLAIITFDLQLDANVIPNQTANLLNTATLFNYAGTEGGPDHTNPTDLTDTAQVTVSPPTATKSRIGTSETSATNGAGDAVIGELVTYELTVRIPEGEMPNAQIVDTLPAGMAFVDVLNYADSPALSVTNPTGTGTAPSGLVVTNSGRTLTFGLGNVSNPDTDNLTDETITIRYRTVVLNVASNQSSPTTNLTNSAQVSWTGGNIAAVSAPTVRVIEPLLDVSKTASASSVDASDTITYTVTVAHGSGSTDAFDVALADALPAGLVYVASSWTHSGGLAPDSLSDAGTLTANWASFPFGSTSTFQFQATVDPAVIAGQAIANTATATWTSLSGTTSSDISSYNTNSRERTGAGGVNDYTDSGAVTVSVTIPTTKSLVATSESSTSGANVAVGEIVRYRIAAQIPEGNAPTLQLVDALPAGLMYLDDGSARIALISDGTGLTSTTVGPSSYVTGTSSSVTPTDPLPAGALLGGPFGDGTDPTFNLGNVVNSDNDADGEFVVIEFNALVTNVVTNVAATSLANAFTVRVNGSQVGSPSSAVNVTLVEPSITNVLKSALAPASSGVDAGQVVTYSTTFSNANTATTSTAHETRILDTLPSGLSTLTNVRVFRNGTQISTGFTNASTTSTLDVTLTSVAANDSIEIRYDATVGTTPAPGATITNTAAVTYTSLPGASGTTSNPTGSSTPGTASSSTGERTGTGGINSYTDNDSEGISVFTHTISGFVYHDADNNGVFNELAANGINNVALQLSGLDHLGNAVNLTTNTNAAGAYSFSGLRPGVYTVTQTQPSGYLPGLDTTGTPGLGSTNSNRHDNSLGSFTIAPGTANTVSANNNFGEIIAATVSGSVYVDANNNGLLSAETGIASVSISLTGTNDLGASVSLTTTTNGSGAYAFTGLRPGTYTVNETSQPSAYVDGLETRGNITPLVGTANGPDSIGSIVASSGQTAANNNFGELPPGTVSGRVFSDVANDGFLTGTDTGLGGIALELTGTDSFGNSVSRTLFTQPDGTYAFTGLQPGTYSVRETQQPVGYFDGQDARNNVLIGGSTSTDVISGIGLAVGGTAANNNFAEVPEVDPVGYVYVDANVNGVHDVGEVGIPGVQITLTGVGNDVFGNPIPARTAFTDGNGFYQFAGLTPGRYSITETQPAGFQDGQEENGTPAATIVNNDQFVDIDLINNAFGGDYNFGELSPTGRLSGSVYVDSNNNGLREPGELGLAGVVITLTDENNPGVSVQVTTNATGNFEFVKMFPGRYRLTQAQPINFLDGRETNGTLGGTVGNDVISGIQVGVNQSGSGYLFGEAGINPARISKRLFLSSANPGSDFTGPPGAGIAAVSVPLADPSGYVYVDENHNGRRDEGERGIANVVVRLVGVVDGKTSQNYVTTDSQGFYQFAYLPPGVYSLFEEQPRGYLDGPESLGTLGGVVGPDSFTQIVLHAGEIGMQYNFAEYLPPPAKPGDANRDGQFNSEDLLQVFQAGEYEDGVAGNSSFEDGDWNGDGDFDSLDLIIALQQGTYVASARRQSVDAIFAQWFA